MFWKQRSVVDVDEQKIDALLSRGVAEVIDAEHLKKRLLSGERLRVKLGIDPTSPNLHLGRSVPLLKLRDFQKLGHQIVFIVGDFTGVIGDTSDKESERPMLDPKVIEKNKETYFSQVGKLIDLKTAELQYNSKWLKKLTYNDVGRHANVFSIADFIARDNIKRRIESGKRVSLREVLYPLMQGYDSVAIKADVEIGGVDQRFNLLAGRSLQEEYGQEPQDIVMTAFPVEGTDGRKMSSSWGNTINFSDEPDKMFGKIMRVRDELVEKYFMLLTRVPVGDVRKMVSLHPRDAKIRLASEIVSLYHNKKSARLAEENFTETFSEGGVPDNITVLQQKKNVRDTVVKSKIVTSNSEWRRLVDAGAIKNTNTGEVLKDPVHVSSSPETFKIGKKIFVRIVP